MPQNRPIPIESRCPKGVCTSAAADVRHNSPIKNTTKAMKNVCTCIICRVSKLKGCSSVAHLKYFGKPIWSNAKPMRSMPMILSCSSIFLECKCGDERRDFLFFLDDKIGCFKCFVPISFVQKMKETNVVG